MMGTDDRHGHRDEHEGSHDDVGELIRLAGQRPPVPEERVARARRAAHAVWLREGRRRSRRKYLWGGAGLAAAASIALLTLPLWRPEPAAGRAGVGGSTPVELTAGEAAVRIAGEAGLDPQRPITGRESVAHGSVISTSETARAALRLPSGHSLRLDRSTEVRLVEGGTLSLERGALYLSSAGSSPAAEGLVVETPLGAIREIGTQFEVRLEDGAIRVRVREGSVAVSHEGGTREAGAGSEIDIDAGGAVTSREIEIWGPEWEWVSEVTPMIDLDGLTARGFLEWAARERGLRLAFESGEVERLAGATILAGELRGMSMDQALASVLPSSRLAHRVDTGRLLVVAGP